MALRYGCRSLECKFGEETRELGRLPKFPNLVIIAEDPLNYVPFVDVTGAVNGGDNPAGVINLIARNVRLLAISAIARIRLI